MEHPGFACALVWLIEAKHLPVRSLLNTAFFGCEITNLLVVLDRQN